MGLQVIAVEASSGELALQREAGDPTFWDNGDKAQQKMRELNELQQSVNTWQKLSERLTDAIELAEMEDEELMEEISAETDRTRRQI